MLYTVTEEPPGSLIPYIPLYVAIVSGLVVGGFAIWNRRRGAVESKIPTVPQLWEEDRKKEAELDIERRLRRWFESAWYDIVRAMHAYVDRVTDGGSHELKKFERDALEATPPKIEKE